MCVLMSDLVILQTWKRVWSHITMNVLRSGVDNEYKANVSHDLFFRYRYMNYNELSWTLEELTGAFSGLASLTRLGLAHNHIRSVAARAFNSLEALRQLHLEDNPLTAIHADAFPQGLNALKLNSSAFLCDCQLGWLGEWLRKKGFGEDDVTAKCAHPEHLRGKSVIDVPADSFECGKSSFFMLTHTYPHKPPRKIKVAIWNHQVDSPCYLWLDVCSGDLQRKKIVWSHMTLNILTETRCQ